MSPDATQNVQNLIGYSIWCVLIQVRDQVEIQVDNPAVDLAMNQVHVLVQRQVVGQVGDQVRGPDLDQIQGSPSARITKDEGKLGGKPCIRGLRISVSQVLAMLGAGLSTDQVLDDYPYLELEDIYACLTYASKVTTTKRRKKR